MTTIDAQTLAALRERFSRTIPPKVCPRCSNKITTSTTNHPGHPHRYSECMSCGWIIEHRWGDPAVLALLDAYAALLARIRGIEVQTTASHYETAEHAVNAIRCRTVASIALTVGELLSASEELASEVVPVLRADASALAALKAEVGEQ